DSRRPLRARGELREVAARRCGSLEELVRQAKRAARAHRRSHHRILILRHHCTPKACKNAVRSVSCGTCCAGGVAFGCRNGCAGGPFLSRIPSGSTTPCHPPLPPLFDMRPPSIDCPPPPPPLPAAIATPALATRASTRAGRES